MNRKEMLLILDEWIIHDLQGDNGEEKQKESYKFLEKIKEKCDKICWIEGSKFSKKFYDFYEFVGKKLFGPELRGKIALLEGSFHYNPQKVESIRLYELNIIEVQKYNHIFKDINPDDHYLIKAYFYLRQKNIEPIIITTDKKLIETLREHNISIQHRDDFIRTY